MEDAGDRDAVVGYVMIGKGPLHMTKTPVRRRAGTPFAWEPWQKLDT